MRRSNATSGRVEIVCCDGVYCDGHRCEQKQAVWPGGYPRKWARVDGRDLCPHCQAERRRTREQRRGARR